MEVYSKNVKIRYLSTICSKATFFTVINKIISIVLPLIVAYNTKEFWLKRESFHEKPNVRFTHEYLFYAEDYKNEPVLCSNVMQLQTENIFQRCSTIKVREFDHNNDGKYDELFFSLTMEGDFNVQSIILILGLDYKIQDVCMLHLKTALIMQYKHTKASNKFYFIGDLLLTQKDLIKCSLHDEIYPYNNSIFDTQNFEIWEFIKENFKNDISTKIDNSYNLWVPGSSSSFNLEIFLRYPAQIIYYKPNFWQVIKFAWIQYLSIFLAFRWIINKIQDYVFTNKLILYHIDSCSNKKNY